MSKKWLIWRIVQNKCHLFVFVTYAFPLTQRLISGIITGNVSSYIFGLFFNMGYPMFMPYFIGHENLFRLLQRSAVIAYIIIQII